MLFFSKNEVFEFCKNKKCLCIFCFIFVFWFCFSLWFSSFSFSQVLWVFYKTIILILLCYLSVEFNNVLYITWFHIMECKKEKNSTKTWFLQLGKNPKKLALFFPLLFHIKKIFFISTKKMAKIFVISWIFDFFRNPNNPAFLHQLHLSFSQVLFWHFHHIFSIRRKKKRKNFS